MLNIKSLNYVRMKYGNREINLLVDTEAFVGHLLSSVQKRLTFLAVTYSTITIVVCIILDNATCVVQRFIQHPLARISPKTKSFLLTSQDLIVGFF